MKSATTKVAVLAAVGALGLAACGSDADDNADGSGTTAATMIEEPPSSTDATGTTDATEATGTTAGDGAATGDLAGVCPAKVVFQTDWFPEAEHGSLYAMIGDDYKFDPETLVTTGNLVTGSDLTDTGIDIEVRSGGPAIGFNQPRAQIYSDDSITFAYANVDSQVGNWEDLPLISVMVPLEINPQMIMWDADEHPDVKTIADVGTAGLTVNLFDKAGFPEVFVAQGIWTDDQLDASYDGTPARFVNDPTIAQQGFASNEPYFYEHLEQYGKLPAYELLHDAGWPIYSQFLGVRPDQLDSLRPCLEQLIPVVQQATVDFGNNPGRTLEMIVDVASQIDGWEYGMDLAQYGADTMTKLGLHGNGPDNTVGNVDDARWQGVIDAMRDANMDVPDDLVASDMYTNEFIDESIGF